MLIRTATSTDCAAIAKIQVDSYRSAYSSLMPSEYLDAFSYSEQEQDWKDWLDRERGLLLVAENEPGSIIGYTLVQLAAEEETNFDCEIVALHVNRVYHRQGAGRALMADAARRMHAQGCRSLGLWVIAGNPAVGFYDRLGGQPTGEHFFEIEELHLRQREIGYVWPRIEDLFGPLPPQRRLLFLTGPDRPENSGAAQDFAASRSYPCALVDHAQVCSLVKSGNAHPGERWDEPAQAQWELARRICAEMARAYHTAGIAVVIDALSLPEDFADWAALLVGIPVQVVVLLACSAAAGHQETDPGMQTWRSVPSARLIDTTLLTPVGKVRAIEQALGG
jgi:GNAT superfamily N-acetyltransferase